MNEPEPPDLDDEPEYPTDDEADTTATPPPPNQNPDIISEEAIRRMDRHVLRELLDSVGVNFSMSSQEVALRVKANTYMAARREQAAQLELSMQRAFHTLNEFPFPCPESSVPLTLANYPELHDTYVALNSLSDKASISTHYTV
jgi:hypothetical protein